LFASNIRNLLTTGLGQTNTVSMLIAVNIM